MGRWLLAGLALGLLIPAAQAQKDYRPPSDYLQLGSPDQAQGRQILEEFRRQGIAGDYYLEFELRVFPRHADERVLHGRLWGTRNASGPVSRVEVDLPPGRGGGSEERLLVQSGSEPSIWRWENAAGEVSRLGIKDWFAPLAGTDLTPFDVQMPFLYWPKFVYEGLARLRGRPAHQFLFYPPDDIRARHPALTGIRAYLDTQYTALVQAELLGEGGRVLKVLSILDLKKVDEQWIVKSIDLRDESTHNKTRFAVTAAALGQKFPAGLFTPAQLAEPAAKPGGLVRLEP